MKMSRYYYLLSMQILEVSENFAKVKMSFSNDFMDVHGFINGGIIAALAEAAASNALLTIYDEEVLITHDFMINFLQRAKADFYCEANLKHRHNNLAACGAIVWDEGGQKTLHLRF